MTKQDTINTLEALIKELPPAKRSQAAGALRTIRTLLEVRDDED